MKEETNLKQIFISAMVALIFLAALVGGILIIDTVKRGSGKVESVSVSDDMAGMHAPPPPADNAKFRSLLGNPAPNFRLTSYDGKEISLSDFRDKNVVLFFSEGAMCYPSCWDQIDSFTSDTGFSKENSVVLTIVVDSETDWDDAVKKDPKLAKAIVLLDSDRSVSASYGVLTVDSSMHRGQYPGHTYVVVDESGVVRYEEDDPNMGINNRELLAEISKLR